MENATQKKIGTLSLCGIYMAYFCSITVVPTGGLVGEGTTFLTGLWGIILGFAIGAVMIALSTWIGYRTGLQKDALWKQI